MSSSQVRNAKLRIPSRQRPLAAAVLLALVAAALAVGAPAALRFRQDQVNRRFADVLGCSNDPEEIQGLLRQGADIHTRASDGTTLLHFAAGYGDAAFISSTLDRGLPVDVPSDDRHTPLMQACSAGRLEAARILLRRGADPNWRSREGNPLGCAVTGGNTQLVRVLVAAGADPNHGVRLDTPLTAAATVNQSQIVETLLDVGARVDQRNGRGRTALMEAAALARLASVEVLLRHHASVTMKDPEGRDVAALAIHSEPGYLRCLRQIGLSPEVINGVRQDYVTIVSRLHSANQDNHVRGTSAFAGHRVRE